MNYDEKLTNFKNSLILAVKQKISERYMWNNEFFMWSYSDIKQEYINKFSENFPDNKSIYEILWFAGQNLEFSIKSYVKTKPNYNITNLLLFVETFLRIQFEDFIGWSGQEYEDSSESCYSSDQDDNPK